jgi:hypothetical protein
MDIKDIEQMELVKFKDGKFGIRRGEEGITDEYIVVVYSYLDLKSCIHWWHATSEFYKDCRSDEETARNKLKSYKNRIELSKDIGEAVE